MRTTWGHSAVTAETLTRADTRHQPSPASWSRVPHFSNEHSRRLMFYNHEEGPLKAQTIALAFMKDWLVQISKAARPVK